MQMPFVEFLGSETFRFIVGSEHKPFNIHTNLVDHLSPVFASLITCKMVESVTKCAILDDVDEDTFIRFCEFAYTGNYNMPTVGAIQMETKPVAPEPEEQNNKPVLNPPSKVLPHRVNDYGTVAHQSLSHASSIMWPKCLMRWVLLTCNKNAKISKQQNALTHAATLNWGLHAVPERDSKIGVAWERFQSVCASLAGPRFLPPRNNDPSESFQDIFLSQARLYVFGDRYDIKALRSLVLYKLRRTLSVFTLFRSRIPDIFRLVEYVYENTPEGDDLRDLLTEYALCKVTFLLEHDDWDSFAWDNRAFTQELLAKLKKLEAG